jgi:hypothetical protein
MQDRPFPFARAVASIAAVTDRDTFAALSISVAAATSALQRARSKLRARYLVAAA